MKKPAIPVGMCPIVAQEAKAKRERQQNRQQQVSSTNSGTGISVLPNSNDPNQKKKAQNANKNQTESSKSSKPPTASTAAATTKSKNRTKKGGNTLSSADDVNDTLSGAINNLSVTQDDDIAKKLKKLRKKVREIEAIEAKLATGELKNPEQDQVDKIGRKNQILDELRSLELLEEQQ